MNYFYSIAYGDVLVQLVALVFLIVLGAIIVIYLKRLSRWSKNSSHPKLDVAAEVVAKRSNVRGGRFSSTRNLYFVTFEVESGDRMELIVSGSEYGQLSEGDSGTLAFQGARYIGFDRKRESPIAT
ncbi:DUF2500 domain-containing protein [Aureibacillus halotolerans]|uniref:Uncharacterized protein DUF2500 n=1 Tax=Aureibacillus halotolerans TaxID=1508390 RepID=A0A4R6U949_9BACI|nr:DUF2500 domain-containing protein [Aureibacillus halotolerans]TDQ41195.1 uncharacterized protein DUF2500 [Aureibacillus halotolerans]